jgi:ferritin-like metal-binding protein YciE
MENNPLAQLLQDELQDIYDAEKQLTKALPKLTKKANSPELKEALESHLQETEGQIDRLEQAFELLDLPVRGKKCKGMANLIKEGEEMISDAEDADAVDAVMIGAAQKVEHYEIAGYGTARTWARVLGHENVATLLEESLEEEKNADQKLTAIAESFVNLVAADEDDAEEGEEGSGARRGQSGRRVRVQAADRRRAKSRR